MFHKNKRLTKPASANVRRHSVAFVLAASFRTCEMCALALHDSTKYPSKFVFQSICAIKFHSLDLRCGYLKIFFFVPGLWRRPCAARGVSTESPSNRLVQWKQLKVLRLLTQLLPNTNRCLLQSVLGLLRRVVENTAETRMTAQTLGTILGPVFVPGFVDFSHSTTNKVSLFPVLLRQSNSGQMRTHDVVRTSIPSYGIQFFAHKNGFGKHITRVSVMSHFQKI